MSQAARPSIFADFGPGGYAAANDGGAHRTQTSGPSRTDVARAAAFLRCSEHHAHDGSDGGTRDGVIFGPHRGLARLMARCLGSVLDARGARVTVLTRWGLGLAPSRRDHHWGALQRIGQDLRPLGRARVRQARIIMVATASLAYLLLSLLPDAMPTLHAMLSLAALACLACAAVLHWADAPAEVRRRVILRHGHCPACLADLHHAPRLDDLGTLLGCPTCGHAWNAVDLAGPAPARPAQPAGCAPIRRRTGEAAAAP